MRQTILWIKFLNDWHSVHSIDIFLNFILNSIFRQRTVRTTCRIWTTGDREAIRGGRRHCSRSIVFVIKGGNVSVIAHEIGRRWDQHQLFVNGLCTHRTWIFAANKITFRTLRDSYLVIYIMYSYRINNTDRIVLYLP